jgi:Mrp family chromosome partitioning ATPase
VLGTAEMHQLITEWCSKFDRVILDGPASLGVADAREVGRFADGVVFVMQAGSHESKPMREIRTMFDREGLRVAGIVFNGMRDRHVDMPIAEGDVSRKSLERRKRLERLALAGERAA